ncbi:DVU_1551 family NTP transferase [Desulfovibrio sp.]|uniref:DVU_1551 family NTP transferase n=1 Tax=Desulfovibrio sp. TaxID=885 RepID=UPI0025C21D0C|nr:NTP transferase domain-containing protein [Desulfovibrio sp.]
MNGHALVLAAGQASRMGRCKALLPLALGPGGRDCTALEGLARLFHESGIAQVTVVTGFHAECVEAAARGLGLAIARNPRPEDGMFSSVCAGLRTFCGRDGASGSLDVEGPVLVQPVDVPLVRPMTLQALFEAHATDQASVLVPAFAGEEGHPPLLPGHCLRQVLGHGHAGGKGGLRGALADLPVQPVAVADSLVLPDMDRPEDYESLRLLAPHRNALWPCEAAELLRLHNVPEKGVRHGRAVGAVAAALAKALAQARQMEQTPGACHGGQMSLNAGLALAGGLLHDICKGEKSHESAAGRLLRCLRLPVMARLVEDHRDLSLPDDQPITERELVFLADKYCYGASFVPVQRRFEQKLEIFGADPAAATAIRGRLERALALEKRLARELACGQTHGQAHWPHPANVARAALERLAAEKSVRADQRAVTA